MGGFTKQLVEIAQWPKQVSNISNKMNNKKIMRTSRPVTRKESMDCSKPDSKPDIARLRA